MSELFGHLQAPAPTPGPDDPGAWHFVRVAVERGMDQRGSGAGLTYRSIEPLPVGRRVQVPLGRGDKASAGIVIQTGGPELADGFDIARIKTINEDTGAGLTPELVELARWMAGYYVCPLGMVLTGMLPAAVKQRTGLRQILLLDRVAEETEVAALNAAKLTPSVRAAWEAVAALPREALPLEPFALAARSGQKTFGAINKLIKLGLLRQTETEDVRERGGAGASASQMSFEASGSVAARPTLTGPQSAVVDGIGASLGEFHVHLLRGITGSGKTEVYLRLIERVLEAGKTAMVLVPEISLTPQISGRFAERFRAHGVAVMHSGLSATQRHKEWSRAARGVARVVVGARSAVFAPLDNMGLVVVDEEHAGDYKQDQLPRYHGRDVAIVRARMAGCPVVLGTATPSLESWANASGPGAKYKLWELTDRVGGGALPRIDVVNLNDERKKRSAGAGADSDRRLQLIGPTLGGAIEGTLREGGQVILLLNKRGYASYIACADSHCGFVLSCDDCDARMVQHRVVTGAHAPRGMVRCHHCQAQRLIPDNCPQCGKELIALGMGTQRIEEELVHKFGALLGGDRVSFTSDTPPTPPPPPGNAAISPNLPREWTPAPGMLRIDGDTMGSARDYFTALSRFASGELKLLVGTQMISKGLDFPNVRLVGVINADTALTLPDFRAAERTFQLVSQVAGRAGRGTIPGRVIVQTVDPSVPAIAYAAKHDYVGFANHELRCRADAGLPPATRMARIVCRDEDLQKAQMAAEDLAVALRRTTDARAPGSVQIVGPMPCPIARIGGFHRLAIEMMSMSRGVIQDVLQAVRAEGLLKSDARTAVDVDPIALM